MFRLKLKKIYSKVAKKLKIGKNNRPPVTAYGCAMNRPSV